MQTTNEFLKVIMQEIYHKRKPLPMEPVTVVRNENADGRPMCEVWFMTEGCAYDRQGGCTMCNYGKGHVVAASDTIKNIEEAFHQLPQENYNLVINPSGSFLDDREVNRSLRLKIYELLDQVSFESLTVESRADVLTKENLFEIRNRYPDKRVSVEIGVEVLHSWLLNYSVNKGMDMECIKKAVELVNNAGLNSVANIGIGLPFLSEKASIIQARKSVLKAFDLGFNTAILFPYHVKPGTLLEVLSENNLYRCVSLWSIAEVLTGVPAEYVERVNISWYRNYYTDKSKIIESPGTCPNCNDEVLQLLDHYKLHPCEAALNDLKNYSCKCHDRYKTSIKEQSDEINLSEIEHTYGILADIFHIDKVLFDTTLREMRERLYAEYQ